MNCIHFYIVQRCKHAYIHHSAKKKKQKTQCTHEPQLRNPIAIAVAVWSAPHTTHSTRIGGHATHAFHPVSILNRSPIRTNHMGTAHNMIHMYDGEPSITQSQSHTHTHILYSRNCAWNRRACVLWMRPTLLSSYANVGRTISLCVQLLSGWMLCICVSLCVRVNEYTSNNAVIRQNSQFHHAIIGKTRENIYGKRMKQKNINEIEGRI